MRVAGVATPRWMGGRTDGCVEGYIDNEPVRLGSGNQQEKALCAREARLLLTQQCGRKETERVCKREGMTNGRVRRQRHQQRAARARPVRVPY